MSNFNRALRLAFSHRLNLAGCVFTSLMVAALWAVNLVAVWPIVDAVMQDMAIPQWIDQQIDTKETQISALNAERRSLLMAVPHTSPDGLPKIDQSLRQIRQDRIVLEKQVANAAWIKPFADKYLPRTPFQTLLCVCAFVMIGTLVKNVFRVANVLLVARLGWRTARDIRNDFYSKVLRLNMADFSDSGRGDLMNRCGGDIASIGMGVQTVIGQAVREPLKMAACFVGAAYFSWRLLLLTIIVAPVAAIAINWISKALKRANRRAMEEFSLIYEALTETLSGIKLIKAFTMETAEQRRFEASNQSLYQRQMRISFYNSLMSPVTENLGIAMVVLAAVMGGYLVLNQQTHLLGLKISDTPLTHGHMSAFFALLAGMSDPARRLSGVFNVIQMASAASDRVYSVLDREPSIKSPAKPAPLMRPAGAISFNDVSFRYEPEKPVLQGVSLDVREGETIAIVGSNGCGKSTLLSLLPRFYDATAGSITIGGIDVRDADLTELRQRMSVVTQESLLMNDTVSINIGYGDPDATQAQIEAAAKQAYAHDFILTKLSDGYDTVVGPGGNRLSGGQRQRIALARAILRDPEILILDEATSQIDLESEQLIHHVLQDFTRDRTTLIITHRPSTLTLADRVVVMDRGKIDDIGTPEELLDRCDLFRRLCHVSYRESA